MVAKCLDRNKAYPVDLDAARGQRGLIPLWLITS
jgi:hypothetical protein